MKVVCMVLEIHESYKVNSMYTTTLCRGKNINGTKW